MKINLNDNVKVRLTDYGRQIIKDQREGFVRTYGVKIKTEATEDE